MSGRTEPPPGSVENPFDVFIIGGGINGCGIARDAAGRGFSVCLAEMNDLASGTSSWSTKLIHGGLRYLEHYKFQLVRKSLVEREVLWANAPHIIRPARFVLPHENSARPAWLVRLGLFIYDHLGGRKLLPPARMINLREDHAGDCLNPAFAKAFEYSDCLVDDSRLVVLNAIDAASHGAQIRTRAKVDSARRENGLWHVVMKAQTQPNPSEVVTRTLVNAAGPWVDQILKTVAGAQSPQNVRLVQGSHIVVKRLYDHDRCYIFQNSDGRVIFAIPYENDFTLIGTTDRDYDTDPGTAEITPTEIDYLCSATSNYFASPVRREDIVWSFSGVRPLFDDGASKAQEATREYVLKQEGDEQSGGLINIFGGKITTYRKLAEEVTEKIEGILGTRQPAWTKTTPLPGGNFRAGHENKEFDDLMGAYPFLAESEARRLVKCYGRLAKEILGAAKSKKDLGREFRAGLTEAEVGYLISREWAMTAEDILWRRTKLGLYFSKQDVAELAAFVGSYAGTPTAEIQY